MVWIRQGRKDPANAHARNEKISEKANRHQAWHRQEFQLDLLPCDHRTGAPVTYLSAKWSWRQPRELHGGSNRIGGLHEERKGWDPRAREGTGKR